LLLAWAAGLACSSRGDVVVVERPAPWPAPGDDRGELCADVADLRVCWGREPRVITRPVPAVAAASPLGWRCSGAGSGRTCVDRLRDAGPFTCSQGVCTQRHPRLPDHGEWTCAEQAGAAVCLGKEAAAGVPPAPPSPGWLCGPRRAPRGPLPGERVCVDLAPDVPDGAPLGWDCRYRHEPAPARLCQRQDGLHALGDACDGARPCVDGGVCAGGRCVPPRPAPTCWLDTDCGRGACRFGTCAPEGQ
jgi:hypothetical protein